MRTISENISDIKYHSLLINDLKYLYSQKTPFFCEAAVQKKGEPLNLRNTEISTVLLVLQQPICVLCSMLPYTFMTNLTC